MWSYTIRHGTWHPILWNQLPCLFFESVKSSRILLPLCVMKGLQKFLDYFHADAFLCLHIMSGNCPFVGLVRAVCVQTSLETLAGLIIVFVFLNCRLVCARNCVCRVAFADFLFFFSTGCVHTAESADWKEARNWQGTSIFRYLSWIFLEAMKCPDHHVFMLYTWAFLYPSMLSTCVQHSNIHALYFAVHTRDIFVAYGCV